VQAATGRLTAILLAAILTQCALAAAHAPDPNADPIDVAQVTTALDNLDEWIGSGPNGDKWRKFLASSALRRQIDQGNQADPAVVARVLQQYRADENGLDKRRFVAASQAIESWLAALKQQYADDLAKLAWASRGDYVPIDQAERLAPARAQLRRAAAKLERKFRRNSQLAKDWKSDLKWELLQPHFSDQVELDDQSLADLTAVLRRFRLHHEGLQGQTLTQAAAALEHYRQLVGWYQLVDEVAQRSRRKRSLAALERAVYQLQMKDLEKYLTRHREAPTAESTRQIGRLLGLIEHLGQSPELVAAVRSQLARPNVFAGATESLLNRLAARPVHETQPVRDFILGASVRGSAVTNGTVSLRTLPADDHMELEITVAGNIRSKTVSFKKPVCISSRGLTSYRATKKVLISNDDFTALPACTAARTKTRTCSVKKTGGNFGRQFIERIARKKVAKSKSQAERIAARRASKKVSAKIDDQIDAALEGARGKYDSMVRPALERAGLFPEHMLFSSEADSVGFEVTLASHHQISTRQQPPLATNNDLTVQIHETSINNLVPSILAGIVLRQENEAQPPTVEGDIPAWIKKLSQQHRTKHEGFLAAPPTNITEAPPTNITEEKPDDKQPNDKAPFKPWSLRLNDQHPVSVSFDNQKLVVRVRIAELKTIEEGEESIRNDWDFLITYAVAQEGNEVILRREGKIEALPTGFDPQWFGDARWQEKLSGKEVSIRRVLEQNLNRRAEAGEGFPREVRIPAIKFKLHDGTQQTLDLAQLDCDSGWLTIGYRWE